MESSCECPIRAFHADAVDALLASVAPSGAASWYLTDHQGSVRAVLDRGGAVVDRIAYDAFGAVAAETNPAADVRFKYTGREWDAEIGLQYNRARYYDPAAGRWISQDPIGFGAGDANLYRYVGNSPTNATDPSGLEKQRLAQNANGDWEGKSNFSRVRLANPPESSRGWENRVQGVGQVASGFLAGVGAAGAAMTGLEPLALGLGVVALDQFAKGFHGLWNGEPASAAPSPADQLINPLEPVNNGTSYFYCP